jgi:hypothetical protein
MGPGETEIFPQQKNQKLARFDGSGVAHAVDGNCHDVTLLIGINHAFLRGGQRPVMRS